MPGYIIKKEYFDVDGVFCSFNCAYAFIKDSKEFIYKDSYTYLLRLAKMLFDKDIDIKPALHWRMLSIFGGHMDIEMFRKGTIYLDIVYLQSTKLQSKEVIKFKIPSEEKKENSNKIDNNIPNVEHTSILSSSDLHMKPICHSFYIRNS